MNRVMWTIVGLLAGAGALMYGWLGWSWMTEGYGLNPVIAFPITTLLILVPIIGAAYYEMPYNEDDFEHITLEKAHCSNCGQHRDLVNGRCAHGC